MIITDGHHSTLDCPICDVVLINYHAKWKRGNAPKKAIAGWWIRCGAENGDFLHIEYACYKHKNELINMHELRGCVCEITRSYELFEVPE
jgi:hypothetical protein